MRDRLIEVINKFDELDFCIPPDWWIENLTDHLIANGVIVSPVPLGSKAYYPVSGTNQVVETKVYAIGIDDDGDTVINPCEYTDGVFGISGYNILKRIYPSREEAEKELERRNGDVK